MYMVAVSCHVTLALRGSWITPPDLRHVRSADTSASTAYLICILRPGHSAGRVIRCHDPDKRIQSWQVRT